MVRRGKVNYFGGLSGIRKRDCTCFSSAPPSRSFIHILQDIQRTGCTIVMSTEETNAKKIINALERLKKKHIGQYLDNICDVCTTEHGWERQTTMIAIEAAKKRGLIHETVVNNEVSYRITNTPMTVIHDNRTCMHTDGFPRNNSG